MSHETFKTCRHEQFDPDEADILVSFKYSAGRPMTMYRNNGDPGDPAEPDEIEILKIEAISHSNIGDMTVISRSDITDLISEAEYEYIETYLFENWASDRAGEEADYRYEQYREERDRE
jgi:hypothetical protein